MLCDVLLRVKTVKRPIRWQRRSRTFSLYRKFLFLHQNRAAIVLTTSITARFYFIFFIYILRYIIILLDRELYLQHMHNTFTKHYAYSLLFCLSEQLEMNVILMSISHTADVFFYNRKFSRVQKTIRKCIGVFYTVFPNLWYFLVLTSFYKLYVSTCVCYIFSDKLVFLIEITLKLGDIQVAC